MTWRAGNDIGRIYRIGEHSVNRMTWDRIKVGDLLLCVKHTGDHHYMYVLLQPRTDNGHSVYFTVVQTVSGYALGEIAFPDLHILNDREMLDMMLRQELTVPAKEVHGEWTIKEGMEVYQQGRGFAYRLAKDTVPGYWQPTSYNGDPAGPARTPEDLRRVFQPRIR